MENAAFLHLRRRTDELYYFRDARHRETDFVARRSNRSFELVQVAWSLDDPGTRERELQGLASAMSALSLREATLVAFDEEEDVRLGGKTIHVRPAWSYLAGP